MFPVLRPKKALHAMHHRARVHHRSGIAQEAKEKNHNVEQQSFPAKPRYQQQKAESDGTRARKDRKKRRRRRRKGHNGCRNSNPISTTDNDDNNHNSSSKNNNMTGFRCVQHFVLFVGQRGSNKVCCPW